MIIGCSLLVLSMVLIWYANFLLLWDWAEIEQSDIFYHFGMILLGVGHLLIILTGLGLYS